MIAGGKEVKAAMIGAEKLSRIYLGETELWKPQTVGQKLKINLLCEGPELCVTNADEFLSKGYKFYFYRYGYFSNRISHHTYYANHDRIWRRFERSELTQDNYVAVGPFERSDYTTELTQMVKYHYYVDDTIKVGSGRNRRTVVYSNGLQHTVKFKMAIVFIHPDDQIQTITDNNSQIFYLCANSDGRYLEI